MGRKQDLGMVQIEPTISGVKGQEQTRKKVGRGREPQPDQLRFLRDSPVATSVDDGLSDTGLLTEHTQMLW